MGCCVKKQSKYSDNELLESISISKKILKPSNFTNDKMRVNEIQNEIIKTRSKRIPIKAFSIQNKATIGDSKIDVSDMFVIKYDNLRKTIETGWIVNWNNDNFKVQKLNFIEEYNRPIWIELHCARIGSEEIAKNQI